MDKLLTIEPDGTVITLYADDLPELGKQSIERASSVEPEADGSGWSVVLTDAARNGKYRGYEVARYVQKREEALRLEVEFIQQHILQGE